MEKTVGIFGCHNIRLDNAGRFEASSLPNWKIKNTAPGDIEAYKVAMSPPPPLPVLYPNTTLTQFPPLDPDDPTFYYSRERMEKIIRDLGGTGWL